MFTEIKSQQVFESLKTSEDALLAYFSTDDCNVCKVLKPKVEGLIKRKFNRIKLTYIKSDLFPEIAAQNRIFSAPTILVFFEGREFIRKSRNIGIQELEQEIQRPYSLIFSA